MEVVVGLYRYLYLRIILSGNFIVYRYFQLGYFVRFFFFYVEKENLYLKEKIMVDDQFIDCFNVFIKDYGSFYLRSVFKV